MATEGRMLENWMRPTKAGLVDYLRELLSCAKSFVEPWGDFARGRDTIQCTFKKYLARQLGGKWAGGEPLGAGLVSHGGSG